MNLETFLTKTLLESKGFFSPRGEQQTVSKETIDKRLKENGVDVIVNAENKTKFKFKDGKGTIPLKCIHDDDDDDDEKKHVLTHKDKKYKFDDLEKIFGSKKDKNICKTCSDEKGVPTKGTSQSELDIGEYLNNFINNYLSKQVPDSNFKIHYGSSGKVLSPYTSAKTKKKLDFDIYIEDKSSGKNVAIMVNGPSHRYTNKEVTRNDSIRSTESFKDNQSFFFSDDVTKYVDDSSKKLSEDFKTEVDSIKRFILQTYNAWQDPSTSKKMRKVEQRVGKDSKHYQTLLSQKREKITQNNEEDPTRFGIKRSMQQLVLALQKHKPSDIQYNGKTHKDLVSYLNNDKNAIISFAKNEAEWDSLLKAKPEEIRNWIKDHQAVSPAEQKFYLSRNSYDEYIKKSEPEKIDYMHKQSGRYLFEDKK